MTDGKFCTRCKHMAFMGVCSRLVVAINPVNGAKIIKELSCKFERAPDSLLNMFNRDRCGPEGKYFEAGAAAPFARKMPPSKND